MILIVRAVIVVMHSYRHLREVTTHQGITMDSMNTPLICLSIVIVILAILASVSNSMKKNETFFLVLILLLLITLILCFSSNNIVMFYIIFEASLVPMLLIILGWGYQPERLQAGVIFILYTVLASLPLLLAMLS